MTFTEIFYFYLFHPISLCNGYLKLIKVIFCKIISLLNFWCRRLLYFVVSSKKLSSFSNKTDWHHAMNYVAKRCFEDVDRQVYFEDVKLQMDAKLWGEEYNRHNPPKKVRIFLFRLLWNCSTCNRCVRLEFPLSSLCSFDDFSERQKLSVPPSWRRIFIVSKS